MVLTWPLFQVNYLDNWGSIESTFIADARFLKEHWPHPRWQPLWYGGTRFDYVYPPALRYGTAVLSMIFSIPTARAYHIYTAAFYCLGIVGVYLLVRTVSGSRKMAWLAAVATSLVSPSYLFLDAVRIDAATRYLTPWRLHVLVLWGEGPHVSALSMVGWALAACYRAMTHKSRLGMAAASVLCALVVSNNFYGAVALSVFFPMLVWSLWVTHRDSEVWLWAAGVVGLGYALTAFWLVPSYFRITLANLSVVGADSEPGHLVLAVAVTFVFFAVTYWLVRGRRQQCYLLFITGSTLAFALVVFGEEWFGIHVVGSPGRVIPELDLVLTLLLIELIRRLWKYSEAWSWKPALAVRVALVALTLAPFYLSRQYLTHAWSIYPTDPDHEQRVEYRISRWMAQNLPHSRSFVDGSVRYWYNAWHDLPQLAGGSHQGLLNHAILPAMSEIRVGESGPLAILWMQAFGVDAIVVNDETSQEFYHDFHFPQKFAGLLPVIWDEDWGDVIYRVPRRYPGLARVVNKSDVALINALTSKWTMEDLKFYIDVVEGGPPCPVTTAWEGTDTLRIHANLRDDEVILLQVSYDPAWRADAGDRPLMIRKDVLGQILIEAPPGQQDIQVYFQLPPENLLGRTVSVFGGVILIAMLVKRRSAVPRN